MCFPGSCHLDLDFKQPPVVKREQQSETRLLGTETWEPGQERVTREDIQHGPEDHRKNFTKQHSCSEPRLLHSDSGCQNCLMDTTHFYPNIDGSRSS